ncbi:MAG: UDP-N-acetylmuramoyl-L-alanyl-D-glutamate--2,6-diaminopimelate ligase [Acidobacteriota bacterium]
MRLDALLAGLLEDGLLEDGLFEDGLPAGADEVEVLGLCHDSRRVAPGDLYLALVGERFDGRDFAADAVARGAVAVLGAPPNEGAARAARQLGVPWIPVDAPRALWTRLAKRLYDAAVDELSLVGVTGTNGKSTVVSLIAGVLDAAGRPSATFGTLGYRVGERQLAEDLDRTTPEAPDLYRLLAAARGAGAEAAAMEVSSHALALGRVDGLRFDVGVFTNLTRDHLDYHGDEESYFAAKRSLFDRLVPGGRAVVHAAAAEPRGRALAHELAERGLDVVRYGLEEDDETLDVRPLDVSFSLHGVRARLATPRGPFELESDLVGRFNLENLLAAVAVAEALELPRHAVSMALAATRPLPGRLEPIDCGQPFPAFVDFAHTPAALEAALQALREISDRNIVCVFGCGGGRDRGKRPEMGEIAGRLAELPVATSDNPRGEDPLAILQEVEKGLRASGNRTYRILPDRRQAIRRAAHAALRGEQRQRDEADSAVDGFPETTGWLVLVAGKGHETTQDLGDRVVPFDDRDELRRAIDELSQRQGVSDGR